MQATCLIGIFLLLSACASTAPVATTPCMPPRPLVCTMEFVPTCAVLDSGGTKEFASPCTACADARVTGYSAKPCPE